MATITKHVSLILLICFTTCPSSQAQTPAAPAPEAAGPANLTGILIKAGGYSYFLRLLSDTQVGPQIQNQLNNSNVGFTCFAPTDNAFNNLKSGTINDLSVQQKVQLVQYHFIPQFLSFSDLQTVSNPVNTLASGSNGQWGLNISAQNNQVNASSGVVTAPVYNSLRQERPLAVYQVDKVLLPEELFGTPTKKAPAPEDATKSSDNSSNSPKPAASAPGTTANAGDDSGAVERSTGLGFLLGLGVMGFVFS